MASGLNLGTSVDKQFTKVVKKPEKSLYDRRDTLIETHREWKSRVNEITSIVNGDWQMIWSNLTSTAEAPSVANIIEMGIHHWSSIGGAILPSVRVPVPINQKVKGGERASRKRERRVRELWQESNINELMAQWWGDYSGTGSAFLGVWADFSVSKKERNPYLHRIDPRYVYPVKDAKGDIIECLVARRVSRDVITKQYPVAKSYIEAGTDSVEEWFWYFPDRVMHIIADTSAKGKVNKSHVVLTDEPNLLERVPIVEVNVPTFDGERRGVFDQTRHILRTMHRLMTLTITSSEEEVYPPVFEYDIMNPDDFGPGAVIHGRSPEARMERMNSRSHFDAKDLIARLANEARSQAAFPGQLQGDPGASIVSAKGIQASMGQIDARLALAHKQFEKFLEKGTALLLGFDEKYCDGEKTIHGDASEKKNPEIFIPSRDIAGHYDVTVKYGIGAGSDPGNRELRLSMNLQQGLISKESARDEMDFLEDPAREELKIVRQNAIDAFLASMLAKAQQGDMEAVAMLIESMKKEDTDIYEIVEKVMEKLRTPPEMAPEGGLPPGGGLPPELGALAGGGPEGLPPLPPLGDMGVAPEGIPAGPPGLGGLGG